jgi:hypothetical protein
VAHAQPGSWSLVLHSFRLARIFLRGIYIDAFNLALP